MVRYGRFGREAPAMVDEETLRVAEALGAIRCSASAAEEELHAQVAQALGAAGIGAAHEVRLAPRCRIDFMAGGIGIEIKKKRPERANAQPNIK